MKNSFLKKLTVLMLTLMMVIPAAAFGFAETNPAKAPAKAPAKVPANDNMVTITATLHFEFQSVEVEKNGKKISICKLVDPNSTLLNAYVDFAGSWNPRRQKELDEQREYLGEKSALDYWRDVEFLFTDMETKETKTVKGHFLNNEEGNDKSPVLILGEFPKNKKYLIKVNPSSLPPGYHNEFIYNGPAENLNLAGQKEVDYRTGIILDTSAERKQDPEYQKFGKNVMNIGVQWEIKNIVFAKDKESAKNFYVINQDGTYSHNPANKVVRIGPDGSVNKPADPVKDGYKFEGWSFKQAYTKEGKRVDPWASLDGFPEGSYDKEYVTDFSDIWCHSRTFGIVDTEGINSFKLENPKDPASKEHRLLRIFSLIVLPKFSRPEVTFDTQGGMPEVKDPMTVGYKKSIKNDGLKSSKMPKNPAKDGYVFTGWNTAKDGSGQEFTADTIVTENITVYAQYKKAGTGNAGGDKDGKIKTGDNTDLGLISLASILSIAGIAFILRRKIAK